MQAYHQTGNECWFLGIDTGTFGDSSNIPLRCALGGLFLQTLFSNKPGYSWYPCPGATDAIEWLLSGRTVLRAYVCQPVQDLRQPNALGSGIIPILQMEKQAL